MNQNKGTDMQGSITEKSLSTFAQIQAEDCISIYLSSNRDDRLDKRHDKNRVALKNHVKEIEHRLLEKGWKKKNTEEYLGPFRKILDDESNWGRLTRGRVFFRREGYFDSFELPFEPVEQRYLGERFYIKPLVPVVNRNIEFYILVLDIKGVGLYKADLYRMEEMDVREFIPSRIEEALGFDYKEKVLQYRAGQEGAGHGMFHGQQVGDELKKKEIKKFLQYVDRGLQEVIHDRSIPLVVSAVDYLFHEFKNISSYPGLVDQAFNLSPDDSTPVRIAEAGRDVTFGLYEDEVCSDIERYHESNTKSEVIEKIVAGSIRGRIDTLFAGESGMIWGEADEESGSVMVHPEKSGGDISLDNLAVIHTLLTGGKVHVIPAENLPDPGYGMNAILRY